MKTEELREIAEALAIEYCGGLENSGPLRNRVQSALAEVARRTRQECAEKDADMFWDDADPEMSQDNPDEILIDGYSEKQIAVIQRAACLPNQWGFWLKKPKADRDDDDKCFYFDSKAEAEAALAAAIREGM